jgi:hypothetical protein
VTILWNRIKGGNCDDAIWYQPSNLNQLMRYIDDKLITAVRSKINGCDLKKWKTVSKMTAVNLYENRQLFHKFRRLNYLLIVIIMWESSLTYKHILDHITFNVRLSNALSHISNIGDLISTPSADLDKLIYHFKIWFKFKLTLNKISW